MDTVPHNTKDLLDFIGDLVDHHPEDAIRILTYCFRKIQELEEVISHYSTLELRD